MRKISFLLFVVFASLFFYSCTKDGIGESSGTFSGGGRSDMSGPSGGSGGGNGGGSAGVMTAGEWNDLENWNFWTSLMQRDTIKLFPEVWGFYPERRLSIELKDQAGRKVHNARLGLTAGNTTIYAVTDNFGRAELFPGLFEKAYSNTSFQLTAEYKGGVYDLGTISVSSGPVQKVLPVSKSISNTLDIMFVVDATGSMGDEINYLKTELTDVITRAEAGLPGTNVRMGSVFYRDHGDQYVTKPFAFTTSLSSLTGFIGAQSAGGGGDTPEAVEEALHEAIQNQQWSTDALNRILFLVLDAPPHQTETILDKVRNAVKEAQKKGIRIIPVSASGIDWPTEFLLRLFSISTGGTYVFITDHSGVGNPHHTPTVGSYQVEYLNNLMVRLITKYGKNVE